MSSEKKLTGNAVVARAVVALSVLTLTGVLAWGVVDGRLTMSSAAGTGENGSPFALASSSSGGNAEGGVLALSADRRTITVLDPNDASMRGEIALSGEAAEITPTPGGVSVFVTYRDRPVIDVYSTTEYGLQTTIELESGAAGSGAPQSGPAEAGAPESGETKSGVPQSGAPEHLTFSEKGDTLIVTYRESDRISVYSHSMRELSNPYHFEIEGSEGPIVRNRRATRLYRRTENGVAEIYAQNGAVVETIDVDARYWQFNAAHTHMWGIGADGRPRAVAERSGTLTVLSWQVEQSAGAGAFAVAGAAERVAVLRRGGEEATVLDARTAEEIGTVSLPFAAARLTATGVGTVWALAADGRVAVIDPSEVAVTTQVVAQVGELAALAPSIVQQEGNFACF